MGRYITEALLSRGKHKVTGLTRPDSKSELPTGIHAVAKADYDDKATLVQALRGQEVLIITLPSGPQNDTQKKLIDAAIEAGVKYIMPNEYGTDQSNVSLRNDTVIGALAMEIRDYIEKAGKGKTHWIALSCSFWYEFSLAGSAARYGFDFDNKSLTLFDDGKQKICTSTWAQCGRAVAKLFSLPILPEGGRDSEPTIGAFEDKAVFITSFVVNQQEMFESVLRVTGDKESGWTVSNESSAERYKRGAELAKQGDSTGYVMMLYSRVFYPNGGGDFSNKVVNDVLSLPKEDLDAMTKDALKLHDTGFFSDRSARLSQKLRIS